MTKLQYWLVILGVLFIWLFGTFLLKWAKIDVDTGFINQVSGICIIILNQLLSLTKATDNGQIIKEIHENTK